MSQCYRMHVVASCHCLSFKHNIPEPVIMAPLVETTRDDGQSVTPAQGSGVRQYQLGEFVSSLYCTSYVVQRLHFSMGRPWSYSGESVAVCRQSASTRLVWASALVFSRSRSGDLLVSRVMDERRSAASMNQIGGQCLYVSMECVQHVL